MKHFKKLVGIMAAIVMCLVSVFGTSLTAYATESSSITYYVKYVPDLGEFRYQLGTWQDNQQGLHVSGVNLYIKDGDALVVEDPNDVGIILDVNVNLSSLTVVDGNSVVVSAKSINNFYSLGGATCSVTGNIANAYIYDNTVANINSNVTNLNIIQSKQDILESSVSVVGTCDHVIASGKSSKHFEFYNFAANTLRVEKGQLKTAAGNYSTTPSSAPSAPSTTTSGEYDDVPKTGDALWNPLWLIGLAAVCFAGSYGVRKMK